MTIHVWEIHAGDGSLFARGQMVAAGTVLGHSLPATIDVDVIDEAGRVAASARGLRGDEETPIARLELDGETVRRTQIWPTDDDLGTPVILPGGEVGILTAWWNAPDHSEWRWSIELHNHA